MKVLLSIVFIVLFLLLGCTFLSLDPIVGCWAQTISLGEMTNKFVFNSDGTFVLQSWMGNFRGTWAKADATTIEIKYYDEVMQKNFLTGQMDRTFLIYEPNEKTLSMGTTEFVKTGC